MSSQSEILQQSLEEITSLFKLGLISEKEYQTFIELYSQSS